MSLNKVNVIVPVYGDWPSLRKNIESLKRYYSNKNWLEVYYINDCGPEADILEDKIKRFIDGLDSFHYYRNEKNLGFVKNCNNAVANIVENKKSDILLLNSDAEVTENSLEDLLGKLYEKNEFGAINPRSNNAGVFGGISMSVPLDASLRARPRESYRLFNKVKNTLPEYFESPSISGYCVLIKREVIDKIGLFDEAYENGYFDDNDFSMRMRENGYKCIVSNRSFVFHEGSKSFSDEYRIDRSKINQRIFLLRYPNYLAIAQQYPDLTMPETPSKTSFLWKLFTIFVANMNYGHTNGYRRMFKRGFGVIYRKIQKNRIIKKDSGPVVQIWSHEITQTGAPLVLVDLIHQWKNDKKMPDNIEYLFPIGHPVDEALLRQLSKEGINFNETNPIELQYNAGDVVVLNTSAYPEWVYEKIIKYLTNGTIKHLYWYIHEDDHRTISVVNKYYEVLRDLLEKKHITIYVPSKQTAANWKNYFGINNSILVMYGRIKFESNMLVPKKPSDFNKIDFVVAGSREPRKGHIDILHAIITIQKYFIDKYPKKYRELTLTIVGNDFGGDFYNRFLENESQSIGSKIKLFPATSHESVLKIIKDCNFTITYTIGESFSLVTMEGMAYGHPIIRSESSGCDEQLKVGVNGWLAKTTSWQSLVDNIEEIINKDKTSNDKLAAMSRESVKIAQENIDRKYRLIDDIQRSLT